MIADFTNDTGEDDLTHLQEILEFHDLAKDPGGGSFEDFKRRSKNNFENRCLHQHVFDTRAAVEMLDYMKLQILAVELLRPDNIVIIAKKISPDQHSDNALFTDIDTELYRTSPFPSDQLCR